MSGGNRVGHVSHPLLPIVSMTLALATATLPPIHTASAETTVAAAATSVPQSLAPAQWCRPIVNAAINPAPLTCWLTLAATEPGSPPATLTGMNLGDLPPWGDIDVEAIGASIARYEQAVAAERAAATPTPPRRPGTQPARSGTGGGNTCGLKPGDFPTAAQLACMGVGSGSGSGSGGSDWDWDGDWDPNTHDDSPLPHDDTFEPIEGYHPLPPPPTNCPKGWWYDSEIGYGCL
jgi:hypothetical protein